MQRQLLKPTAATSTRKFLSCGSMPQMKIPAANAGRRRQAAKALPYALFIPLRWDTEWFEMTSRLSTPQP